MTQAGRPLRVATELTTDPLVATGFSGVEGMSRPYSFRVDLISRDPAVDASKLLRTPVALTIVRQDGSERVIHGFINHFAQLGQQGDQVAYQLEVVPWLWFLSLSQDHRIFQKMSVLQIVEKVVEACGYRDFFDSRCIRTYPEREYCVQYGETHLDFISRLLEEEGIFYYFEHEQDKHKMILVDHNSQLPVCPGLDTGIRVTAEPDVGEDAIAELQREEAVHTGMITLKHYDYLQPSLRLLSLEMLAAGREDRYHYPGKYTTMGEGERLARLRLEEAESRRHLIRGSGAVRSFEGGTRFELREHYRADANQEYILLTVQHHCVANSYRSGDVTLEYQNVFTAIPSEVTYRPPLLTRKPVVHGSQTAVVVGKEGEEIWTDPYGRVKVQFHWDLVGERNEHSSCWVRVASSWAGKQWGAVQIPRVGQEVVVAFLEGDPDQPIIIGSVYNAEQLPPYLPDHPTQSGVKSRSSKGGGPGNFNEFRFEDKKGQEEVYLHAERNLRTVVEADESRTVRHDRVTTIQREDKKTIKDGKVKVLVEQGNYEVTANKGEMHLIVEKGEQHVGNRDGIQLIGVKKGTQNLTVTEGDQYFAVNKGNQHIMVNNGNQKTTIKGEQTNTVKKKIEITVEEGNHTTTLKKGGQVVTAELGSIIYTAKQSIELVVGANVIRIDNTGITIKSAGKVEIKGATVNVNS
jgi:type VI secretion system secreted protein VgrG